MRTVAALYVERGGPYFDMPDVEPWDIDRDARKYNGPHPVVAHPPCGPWGRLRHLYRGNEHDCAPAAVASVREWGGVLEHPAWSRLWPLCGLPEPGGFADEHGGITIAVDQCAYGHVARKNTWLYVVGVPLSVFAAGIRTGGTPTHWISGGRGRQGKKSRTTPVPPGIKVASALQRRRTPPAFAAWLVELARSVRRDQAQIAEAG